MSNAITRTYSFANGGVADGGQVDSEIQNIVNTMNNADAGTTTWTVIKATTINAVTTMQIAGNTFSYTPVTAFTPTVAGGGTITNATGWYQQIGQIVSAWGSFKTGTVAASTAKINVPTGSIVYSGRLPTDGSLDMGQWTIMADTVSIFGNHRGVWFADGTDTAAVYAAYQTPASGTASFAKILGTTDWLSTSYIPYSFWYPVA